MLAHVEATWSALSNSKTLVLVSGGGGRDNKLGWSQPNHDSAHSCLKVPG